MLARQRAIVGHVFGHMGQGERGRVWHCRRVGAGAVGAVGILCAKAPVATAPAALAVQRGDLWLAQVRQNTLTAGGGPQGYAVPGRLALSVVYQKTVNVLQPGPASATPLKGPFVTDGE